MQSERQESVSKSELWSSHIAGWESSGQTQRIYCETHGLNFSVFCYWRKKLSERASSRPLIPITVLPDRSEPSSGSSLRTSGLSLWWARTIVSKSPNLLFPRHCSGWFVLWKAYDSESNVGRSFGAGCH